VKELADDEAAMARIAAVRDSLKERIQQHKLTGNGHPTPAENMMRRVTYGRKYKGTEKELIETNPEKALEYEEYLSKTVAFFSTLLEAQRVSMKSAHAG